MATTAKAKRVELDRINGNLIDLKAQFEQLAIESPFAEREIYENSLEEIDSAIKEKVQPMEDFDFPTSQNLILALSSRLKDGKNFDDHEKIQCKRLSGKVVGVDRQAL